MCATRVITKKAETIEALDIIKLIEREAEIVIKGTTPMVMNRLAEKSRQQLLLPPAKKNAAAKAQSLKHDPLEEFRAAAHRMGDPEAPTLLGVPSVAFKGAMRSAALEMPGISKAQIGRLTFMRAQMIPVYGVPQLFCSVTRMADIGKTPDVRTRVILPRWALVANVTFIEPQLRFQSIANLIAAAGLISGIGDWRPEKGSGSYGQFEVCLKDDAEFLDIVKSGGRAAQEAALADPVAYDDETEELLSWFDIEARRRGLKAA